jgi:thioredoxin reductase (NADPH)
VRRIGDVPLVDLPERVFPTLTPAQIGRIIPHGRVRSIAIGDVLIEQGMNPVPFFVVISGELETIRSLRDEDTVISVTGAGQFTGEISALSGRNALFRLRVVQPGEVIELDHRGMLSLLQTDAELGEIVMRAFILRRATLVAAGVGDVVLVGSRHSAGTLRIREFLTRNGHPYAYIDLERDPDVQTFMDAFHISADEIPVVICRGQSVLRNPQNHEIARCLGFNESIDATQVRDLVIVGAGPSGLAAAVYGASEGLDVLVVETSSPGGQAGSSSRIENYLGFPTGVSGQELAARAFTQAEKFGAEILIATSTRLRCSEKPFVVETDDGTRIPARTIVIATGVQYRKLPLANLSHFEGVGVYYGATFVEAQLCGDDDVIVVGGANSAGQAAVFLARTSKRVHMLIRGDALAATMSRYLTRRIEDTPTIVVHPNTEIVELEGDDHLESVRWQNNKTGVNEERAIRHVFLMTGGVPNTDWLSGCVEVDANGFVKTGPELSPEDLTAAHWPLLRAPYLLETSLPGVFAVGDVRSNSMKRVASAVGEGSIAISFVHQVLQT